MNIRQLIYNISPSFIKHRIIRNLKTELIQIDEMLIPSKMIAYEDYLQSLYDFSFKLPVTFREDFSLMNRLRGEFKFESSQKLLVAIKKAIDFPWSGFKNSDAINKEIPFSRYYSNPESINEVKVYIEQIIYHLILIRLQTTGELNDEQLEVVREFHPTYLDLLSSRFVRDVLNDFTLILEMILVSNSGGVIE